MRDENARLRGLDAGELVDLLALCDVFAHEPFDPRAVVSARAGKRGSSDGDARPS